MLKYNPDCRETDIKFPIAPLPAEVYRLKTGAALFRSLPSVNWNYESVMNPQSTVIPVQRRSIVQQSFAGGISGSQDAKLASKLIASGYKRGSKTICW
jgi:hypothetical protein